MEANAALLEAGCRPEQMDAVHGGGRWGRVVRQELRVGTQQMAEREEKRAEAAMEGQQDRADGPERAAGSGGIWQGRRVQRNPFSPARLQGLSMHISWDNHSNSHHSQPQ